MNSKDWNNSILYFRIDTKNTDAFFLEDSQNKFPFILINK